MVYFIAISLSLIILHQCYDDWQMANGKDLKEKVLNWVSHWHLPGGLQKNLKEPQSG